LVSTRNVVVHCRLLEEGEQRDKAAQTILIRRGGRATASSTAAEHKHLIRIVVIVKRNRQLLELIVALSATGCFASSLNGRQQQCYQHADDGNDHQQFDERKRGPARPCSPERRKNHVHVPKTRKKQRIRPPPNKGPLALNVLAATIGPRVKTMRLRSYILPTAIANINRRKRQELRKSQNHRNSSVRVVNISPLIR
jgi:hypothetical protein